MAPSTKDIVWLAGLLEGEGCFQTRPRSKCKSPFIQLVMTDKDVVIRAAKIMGSYRVILTKKTKSGKDVFRCNVYGKRAISWMMTILPLMGERRTKKITEIIRLWKDAYINDYPTHRKTRYVAGPNVVWESESRRAI